MDEPLRRLQTDRIDLLQFHEIIRMSDLDRVFAPSGAIEAVLAARDAGKIRYIGFTGYKSPDIHLKMLDTARAASVLVRHGADSAERHGPHYDSFQWKVYRCS